MLLNEFYTPSSNDLKIMALIVLGDGGVLKFDAIRGNEALVQSAARLANLGLITVIGDDMRLTDSGNTVSRLNGVSDGAGQPTQNAYNHTTPKPS